MVTMPRTFIHEHHLVFDIPIRSFLIQHANHNGVDLPEDEIPIGEVDAELHRGRWIVQCPEVDCAGAVLVTTMDPVYMCPDCGSGWYNVVFPKNKAAIEREVLKRKITRKGLVHANWKGETIAELREQTLKAEGD